MYRLFWDTDIGLFFKGYWDIVFFILGYGIFRNFGIWDIGIYFGIRVKLILGYGIFWTVYFGIWDITYPPNQASLLKIASVKGADEALGPFFSHNIQYPVHLPISCKFFPSKDILTVLPIPMHNSRRPMLC